MTGDTYINRNMTETGQRNPASITIKPEGETLEKNSYYILQIQIVFLKYSL